MRGGKASPANFIDLSASIWSLEMKNQSQLILVFAVYLIILILNPKLATAQEVENQNEFNYIKGSAIGPDKWGDLHGGEWAACRKGNLQSPIDLLHERVEVVSDLGKIKRSYRTANATLKNRGHDITLKWEIGTAGSIEINGTDYALEQLHWHSPSEHTINGRRFALELHMVHRSVELNKAAVIGVMYNIGRPKNFLAEIEKDIRAIANSNGDINVGMKNPKHIKLGGRKYYRYLGSLTTPPCTEGVIWTINKRMRTVSVEQLKLLRAAVHDDSEINARPLQPLNDRSISFYDPKHRLSDGST